MQNRPTVCQSNPEFITADTGNTVQSADLKPPSVSLVEDRNVHKQTAAESRCSKGGSALKSKEAHGNVHELSVSAEGLQPSVKNERFILSLVTLVWKPVSAKKPKYPQVKISTY